jgi:homoserine O-acetyltransferase/O-succinyltransferase
VDEYRDLWWKSPTKELASVAPLELTVPFVCQYGGRLGAIQVSWEEWGQRSPANDNTVLVIHPMTADCHVTGAFCGQPLGWWEDLIGPGRAIDTDRYHVVCPDLLGGCYGTTGPRFPAEDGAPYLDRFPLVTPRDVARVHRLFLDAIGVPRPALVIGPSMGGMVAWEWAVASGDEGERVAVVAAPTETTPLQIAWNWLQRTALDADLAVGFPVARGVGMLSYRSPDGLAAKFSRDLFRRPGSTLAEAGLFNVESWLRQHGRRLAKRFDPWTWRVFARTMDLHDLAAGRDGRDAALRQIRPGVLVFGISSDHLYPARDVREAAQRLSDVGGRCRYAEIESANGHDAFLIDVKAIGERLEEWLAETAPA